jgi:hypothetical protein
MQLVTLALDETSIAAGVSIDNSVFIPSAAIRVLPDLAAVSTSVKSIIEGGEATLDVLRRALDLLPSLHADLIALGRYEALRLCDW